MIAAAGHDVASVADQGLEGSLDGDLLEYCRAEGRCLVTLDLEFANPLVFLPSRYPGIAVLRIPQKASATDLLMLIETLMEALKSEVLIGKLWIVEIGRIRVYEEEDADRTRWKGRDQRIPKDRSTELGRERMPLASCQWRPRHPGRFSAYTANSASTPSAFASKTPSPSSILNRAKNCAALKSGTALRARSFPPRKCAELYVLVPTSAQALARSSATTTCCHETPA